MSFFDDWQRYGAIWNCVFTVPDEDDDMECNDGLYIADIPWYYDASDHFRPNLTTVQKMMAFKFMMAVNNLDDIEWI